MAEMLNRREVLGATLGCLGGMAAGAIAEDRCRLATFSAEVTPPLGHALMGGGIAPAKMVEDPLFVHGLVLWGADKPIVLAAIDWCEVRNDAYDRWRTVLAEAAGTEPARVVVACLHQHDAPIADLAAERLLEKHKAAGSICMLDFHEKAVQTTARALRKAAESPRRFTHVGTGQAKVEKVASNRRFPGRDGKPLFGRTSATRDAYAREQPEGTIDPWMKTLSFWDGDQALAAVSCYATHPMSYYGKGGVSADFVGMARKRRQAELPRTFQIYLSGCSGNVTAGKYNDGNPDNRPVLADRLYKGMAAAWEATRRQSVESLNFRSVPLKLAPRDGPGFSADELKRRLIGDKRPFGQCLAALGLSWRQRCDEGRAIDVPVVELGNARLLLMPAESYVEYQLLAQKQRPDCFVLTAGYGECGPGYIPTQRAVEEHDGNLSDWCWVAPGAEKAMTAAIEAVLGKAP